MQIGWQVQRWQWDLKLSSWILINSGVWHHLGFLESTWSKFFNIDLFLFSTLLSFPTFQNFPLYLTLFLSPCITRNISACTLLVSVTRVSYSRPRHFALLQFYSTTPWSTSWQPNQANVFIPVYPSQEKNSLFSGLMQLNYTKFARTHKHIYPLMFHALFI